MTLLVDAGPLIVWLDRDDPVRPTIRDILAHEAGPLVLPVPVSAEVDDMVGRLRHRET